LPADGGTPETDGGSDAGEPDAGSPDAGMTAPTQLTAGESAIALALDATNVYWLNSNPNGGRIDLRTVPKSGGTPVTLASSFPPGGADPVGGFIQAGGYWFYSGTVAAIMRNSDFFANGFGQLAADQGLLYAHFSAGGGEIVARNFIGDHFQVLAQDQGYGQALLLDGRTLYWTATLPDGRSQIVSMDALGGAMTAVMRPGNERPVYLKAAGGFLFFREEHGDVERVRQDGVNAAPQLLWGAPEGSDLDLKDGRVYWTQSMSATSPGCVGTANYDGTDGRCIDEGRSRYFGVRVDDTAIYFVRDLDVFRLPRQ
jgi:hypothetical protein